MAIGGELVAIVAGDVACPWPTFDSIPHQDALLARFLVGECVTSGDVACRGLIRIPYSKRDQTRFLVGERAGRLNCPRFRDLGFFGEIAGAIHQTP